MDKTILSLCQGGIFPQEPSDCRKLGVCGTEQGCEGKDSAVGTCCAHLHRWEALLPAGQALGPMPSLLGSTFTGTVCLLPSSNFYFWTIPSERHILSLDVLIPSIRLLWPVLSPFI